MTSNKKKDSLNRLIILEKLIELKSNECAYYRTKVHLMQMSSMNLSMTKKSKKRSSSEDNSQSSISNPSQSNSIEQRHRRNSLPKLSQEKSMLKKDISHCSIPFEPPPPRRRYRGHKTCAQNQNSSEHIPTSQAKVEQMFISYLNKHLPRSVAQDKNIQCNENDFHAIESLPTILKIRLPHRFVKSLLVRHKKSSTPRLKVHLSAQLLNKLFQSLHTPNQNQFTIQSQYGKIAACINQDNSMEKHQSKAIHAKAEVKIHHEDRLPIVRHIARTRSDGSDRRKILLEKTRHANPHKHRPRKRHFRKSTSTSHEESKRSSLTNPSETIGTLPSTDPTTSNSIIMENTKQKRNRINIKR